MPNVISLSASIASTRESWVLTDNSTFDPVRSDYRVYIDAQKLDYQLTPTTLTVDSYDPATVDEWNIEYTVDGSYRVNYVIIPEYDVATQYNQYDAVWYGTTVYRSLVNSNTGNDPADTNYWEVITTPADLAANEGESNESLNIDSVQYLRVFAADSQYTYGNFISDSSTCTDCDQAEILAKYDLFSLLLRELEVCDQRSELIDGELIARKIESIYIDCE